MPEIIEEGLQRLESIDNTKYSEALKCLDKLAKQIELDEDTDYWEIRKSHKTVENSLIKAEKEHNALEIIKKKLGLELIEINRRKVLTYLKDDNDNWLIKMISEEEYNVLKDAL